MSLIAITLGLKPYIPPVSARPSTKPVEVEDEPLLRKVTLPEVCPHKPGTKASYEWRIGYFLRLMSDMEPYTVAELMRASNLGEKPTRNAVNEMVTRGILSCTKPDKPGDNKPIAYWIGNAQPELERKCKVCEETLPIKKFAKGQSGRRASTCCSCYRK